MGEKRKGIQIVVELNQRSDGSFENPRIITKKLVDEKETGNRIHLVRSDPTDSLEEIWEKLDKGILTTTKHLFDSVFRG